MVSHIGIVIEYDAGLCFLIRHLEVMGLMNMDELIYLQKWLHKELELKNFKYKWKRGEVYPRYKWLKEQISKLESNE